MKTRLADSDRLPRTVPFSLPLKKQRRQIVVCALMLAATAASFLPASSVPESEVAFPNPSEKARALLGQPYASYWFPSDLLSWSPATDPDAAFNRSNTPLRDRFSIPATQANDHARANEARVTPLDIFAATSGNPSQGSLDINYFAFNYWQYVDVLVFWGGSAGEGLILAPNPGIIDAAHRNGVPVLGTIFFPPVVYGGNIQWVRDLVQRDGNSFPVADKLIQVAEHYGFDGYFVNQETAGGNAALAGDLIDFMKYIQANSDLELMWYDAMTENGPISWQEQLNSLNDGFFQDGADLVSEHMFLDFGWTVADLQNSRSHALGLGRSEFDLYAGVDVQANGYNTFANWNAVFPEGQPHVTSLGLYVPSWTYHSAANHLDFYTRANRFWVGANRDPSNTTTTHSWKGLAHYVPAHSPINDLPFTTNFGTGHGYHFSVDGIRLSHPSWDTTGWNNLSLQDILPTWRWLINSDGTTLYPEIDWSDAYYGGSCLKVSGELSDDNHLQLFSTDLPMTAGAKLDIAYATGATGATHMQVGLAFTSDPETFVFLGVPDTVSDGWNLATINLDSYAGESIAVISLFFSGGAGTGYETKVGRLSVYESAVSTPAPPSNLEVESKFNDGDIVTLRLSWTHAPGNVNYYNVYRRNPDTSLTYLGGTTNNAYFVPEVHRVGSEAMVTVEIEAVGLDFGHSSHATASFDWFSPPAPAANPDPSDGNTDVPRNTLLAWSPGLGTESHDVAFGTSNPPPFHSNVPSAVFNPGPLSATTTYFWRIDERNPAGTTPGPVWSFTTGTEFIDTTTNALVFDGSNDQTDCGNDPSLQITGTQITIEAMIRASTWRNNVWEGSIVSKEQSGPDNGYMLRAGNNGQLNFNFGSGSWNEINSSSGAMQTDVWHHVAGTYDGATMKLYIDGQLVAQQSRSVAIANAESNMFIGASQSYSGRVFDGAIDEVRVWNVARTQAELQSAMDQELGSEVYLSPASGLVGYWRLNEGTGQITFDLTGFANHGTLGTGIGIDDHDPLWVTSDAVTPNAVFSDGFESGDTNAWSHTTQ